MRTIMTCLLGAALIAQPLPPSPAAADDNPRVTPGLVRWHQDVAAAQTAAKKSRRPVLVLQILGDLDREFC
jgi:hypothetical protein